MRFLAAVTCLVVGLAVFPSRADAITVRELIDLSKAGVGEEVLIALIEIDQRVFPTDPATIRSLKDAGVSEKVIVALVRSGRMPVVPETAPVPGVAESPEPQVIVVERERPVVREVSVVHEVPVAVPVYVAVPVHRRSRSIDDDRDDRARKSAEPVYWGWGGKRRPDSWEPSPQEKRREQKR